MPRSTSGIVDGTTSGLLLEVDLTGAARGRQAEALADQLRRAVRTGTLPIGTRLPASRSLAADLGVSRGVVVRAYDQLVAEGYLAGRRGSGTIVAGGTDPGPPAPLRPVTRSSNPGLPSGGTFPRVEWARCAARALATLTDAELGYGDPAGLPHLREELARYLGRVRAVLAPPERVVVVNGFAQASRLVAEVLRGGGTTRIAVEDPGSIGLRDQFTASGLTCVAVPVDGEGMQVDALAASGVRAVVVTPAHQFPTGAVTSPPRRHALLEWARSCGGLVVPEHLVATYRDAKYTADLARGVLDQATFAELLASGEMDRHIRRMAVEYRRRRDHLVAAVTASLPGWEVTGAAAGLHLVLHPPGGDDEALARQAQACGLDARALSRYSLGSPRWPGLVVGYGHQPPARLTAAIEALARALNRQR